MWKSRALASALLACSATAHAGDLRLEYVVEQKPLKQGLAAGDALQVELFSDAECTALVGTTEVAADSIELLSRLTLARLLDGEKPPKAVEIRTTLSDVPPFQVYARVNGPGVVPVGGDCQLQHGTPREINFLTVDNSVAHVRAASPALQGSVITRPAALPVGVYCVDLPPDVGGGLGAVGTVEKSIGGIGSNDDLVNVTRTINNECFIEFPDSDLAVHMYTFDGSNFVLADRVVTLLIPTNPQ
jgi:hypothetical protein